MSGELEPVLRATERYKRELQSMQCRVAVSQTGRVAEGRASWSFCGAMERFDPDLGGLEDASNSRRARPLEFWQSESYYRDGLTKYWISRDPLHVLGDYASKQSFGGTIVEWSPRQFGYGVWGHWLFDLLSDGECECLGKAASRAFGELVKIRLWTHGYRYTVWVAPRHDCMIVRLHFGATPDDVVQPESPTPQTRRVQGVPMSIRVREAAQVRGFWVPQVVRVRLDPGRRIVRMARFTDIAVNTLAADDIAWKYAPGSQFWDDDSRIMHKLEPSGEWRQSSVPVPKEG